MSRVTHQYKINTTVASTQTTMATAASAPSSMLGEREVVRNTGKEAIGTFLESQACYSVLRASGKVVVFDTRIPIQLAFYALVEHGEFQGCVLACAFDSS